MPDPDDLVEVAVLVPRQRVPEFYERHAQWLRADQSRWGFADFEAPNVGPEATTPSLMIIEDRPWEGEQRGDGLADAINIYDRLSIGAKKIIDILLAHPGEKISGDSLGRQLNLSQAQLTGTLASVRLRSKAARRVLPFRYEPGPAGGSYWIEPQVAELFDWARAQPADVVAVASKYDDYRRRYWDVEVVMDEMPADADGTKGLPFALEGSVFEVLEDAGFELTRVYRRDMNQPEPERSGIFRRIPQSQDEGGTGKEVWMAFRPNE